MREGQPAQDFIFLQKVELVSKLVLRTQSPSVPPTLVTDISVGCEVYAALDSQVHSARRGSFYIKYDIFIWSSSIH